MKQTLKNILGSAAIAYGALLGTTQPANAQTKQDLPDLRKQEVFAGAETRQDSIDAAIGTFTLPQLRRVKDYQAVLGDDLKPLTASEFYDEIQDQDTYTLEDLDKDLAEYQKDRLQAIAEIATGLNIAYQDSSITTEDIINDVLGYEVPADTTTTAVDTTTTPDTTTASSRLRADTTSTPDTTAASTTSRADTTTTPNQTLAETVLADTVDAYTPVDTANAFNGMNEHVAESLALTGGNAVAYTTETGEPMKIDVDGETYRVFGLNGAPGSTPFTSQAGRDLTTNIANIVQNLDLNPVQAAEFASANTGIPAEEFAVHEQNGNITKIEYLGDSEDAMGNVFIYRDTDGDTFLGPGIGSIDRNGDKLGDTPTPFIVSEDHYQQGRNKHLSEATHVTQDSLEALTDDYEAALDRLEAMQRRVGDKDSQISDLITRIEDQKEKYDALQERLDGRDLFVGGTYSSNGQPGAVLGGRAKGWTAMLNYTAPKHEENIETIRDERSHPSGRSYVSEDTFIDRETTHGVQAGLLKELTPSIELGVTGGVDVVEQNSTVESRTYQVGPDGTRIGEDRNSVQTGQGTEFRPRGGLQLGLKGDNCAVYLAPTYSKDGGVELNLKAVVDIDDLYRN